MLCADIKQHDKIQYLNLELHSKLTYLLFLAKWE